MRRKFTVYGLRFSKTSFWNRINTGFPDPAVATVLTACGIETSARNTFLDILFVLQQYLPLAVLKHAYGINLKKETSTLQQYLPLAVLKLFVLIHWTSHGDRLQQYLPLAVLKLMVRVDKEWKTISCNSTYRLRYWNWLSVVTRNHCWFALQQYLPLAVLKPFVILHGRRKVMPVGCNSTYRLRYWNSLSTNGSCSFSCSCNSTYRLRYWNWRT